RRRRGSGSVAHAARTQLDTIMSMKDGEKPADNAPVATDPHAEAESRAGDRPAESSPQIEALTRERDETHDRLLRKTAEFDNYRKRIERERREQADQAVTNLLLDLLAIVDDFERALEADTGGEHDAAYRKGLDLIYAKLQDLLRKRGVRPIEALGTDFDPNL